MGKAAAGGHVPPVGEGLLQRGADQLVVVLGPGPGPQVLRAQGVGGAGSEQVLGHLPEPIMLPASPLDHGPEDGVPGRVRLQSMEQLPHLRGGFKSVDASRKIPHLLPPVIGGSGGHHHPHVPGKGLADVVEIFDFAHERPKARLGFLPHGCKNSRLHCSTAPTNRKGVCRGKNEYIKCKKRAVP